MSDQDMFGTQTQTTNPPAGDPGQVQTNPFADKLEQIKNEQGEPKYKDVETALDALNSSQQFIPQLQSENAQLKQQLEEASAQLQKMGNIEDFVKKVAPTPATPPVQTETPAAPQGLSEEKVAELLEQRLSQREKSQQENSNLESVVSKLSEQYGDKAAEVIKQKAQELNTTAAELQQLAKSNPTMALSLLGGVKVPSSPTPSQSTTVPPIESTDDNPVPELPKNLTQGGFSNKVLAENFKKVQEYTNKRLGVES